jgi:RNA polymerase sigma-70 factor (ECF subfamily)
MDMTRTAFARHPLRVVDSDAYASVPAPSTDEEFFSRFAPYVARVGLRLLGREPEVDDLIQDVFVIAYKKRAQLRDPSAAKAWLATIAVRIARKNLRRRRLKRLVGLDHARAVELIDPAVSPEKRALLSRVYEILDRMDVDCRLAWTLRYVEGETLEGVALRCGCSLATAKRRVSAAQTLLGGEVGRG